MEREQVEAYVDAAAGLLNLPLRPEHRPGVLMYFGLASGLADAVMAHPLHAHDDPAPVFTPIAPEDVPLPDKKRAR